MGDGVELIEQEGRRAALGREARSHPFERAANLDRVEHVPLAKRADRVTTVRQGLQQSFLAQLRQGGTRRRA